VGVRVRVRATGFLEGLRPPRDAFNQPLTLACVRLQTGSGKTFSMYGPDDKEELQTKVRIRAWRGTAAARMRPHRHGTGEFSGGLDGTDARDCASRVEPHL
jgi:hypothetical protein